MEKILVLDFGGQYNQLIARRVRDQHVYAEIKPCWKITPAEIAAEGYRGIIFTGGPNSVYDPESPHYDPAVMELGIPILGICYGDQLLTWMGGGEVSPAAQAGEYGKTELSVEDHPLFRGVPRTSICWMSHRDYISKPPVGFRTLATTAHCPCAAMGDDSRKLYGVQFHPEVTDTEYGELVLHNFLYNICGCTGDWTMEKLAQEKIAEYRAKLSGKKVLCALSGGVDSSVAAMLLHKAIGDDLVCVFVDHGLLRKDEAVAVERMWSDTFDINLIKVDAQDRFLARLAGVKDPDQKRAVISKEFISIFKEQAEKLGTIHYLVQGTIYSDVLERGSGDIKADKVGELADVADFDEIIEPLRDLFKDEVRRIGLALGLPRELVWQQPFPGPGLALRCTGEITANKLALLRETDAIFRDEIVKAGYDRYTNQYFTVLTDTVAVGVTGDHRTYGSTVVLRAVTSDDFMTADWSRVPYEVLAKTSERITNEVEGITRVVYDITPKPPATVEWV